jgi:hypothetical protein
LAELSILSLPFDDFENIEQPANQLEGRKRNRDEE